MKDFQRYKAWIERDVRDAQNGYMSDVADLVRCGMPDSTGTHNMSKTILSLVRNHALYVVSHACLNENTKDDMLQRSRRLSEEAKKSIEVSEREQVGSDDLVPLMVLRSIKAFAEEHVQGLLILKEDKD